MRRYIPAGWCRESGTACPCRRSRDTAPASPSDCPVAGSYEFRNAEARDFAGVGCQGGHSVLLPTLAMPDHAMASSPTVMP